MSRNRDKQSFVINSNLIKAFLSAGLLGLMFLWPFLGAARTQQRKRVVPNSERVYLVHSDLLRFDQVKNPDANILNGNVHFLHLNVNMYCDSAYFYKESNSFEAFGNVRMVQGDTLSLTGEYLYYDGTAQIAQVRKNVHLKHRSSLLITDSLNYDKLYNVGYFFEGGKLIEGENVLTSDWGEYSPATREAVFNYNVKLKNPKYTLTSDTLHYNTRTKWSHMVGPSNVVEGQNRIYTENGFYNTQTGASRLLGRSTVVNGGKTMVGDSLVYDKEHGVMEGFRNVVSTDKVNKNMLIGDYCYYNESNGYAVTTGRALAKDFSNQADTLFMHADTLKLYSYNLNTDSAYREVLGYKHVRSYRSDVQTVCDSLHYNSAKRCISMYGNPIVWSSDQQLLGEEIHTYMNDSTIDSAHVVRQALLVEKVDSIHYHQITSHEMMAYFKHKVMDWSKAVGNVQTVYYPFDSDSIMIGLNRMESTEMRMFMKNRKMNRIWSAASSGVLYPLALAPADMLYLENFAWFDYIRPQSKDDLFEWRAKRAGTELKASYRRTIPFQSLQKLMEKNSSN